jgi:hypothetical protein
MFLLKTTKMNTQIKAVYHARLDDVTRKSQETKSRLAREIENLMVEQRFAAQHCNNRTTRIRELIEEHQRMIQEANDATTNFQIKCQPFLDMIEQQHTVDPHDIERFFAVMGVMYNPSVVQHTHRHHPHKHSHTQTPTSTSMSTSTDELNNHICPRCDELRIHDEYEAYAVCPKCGGSVPFQKDTHDVDDTMQYTIQFEYERQTHLREYINQIVKAEDNAASVPIEIIRGIKRQILKERIKDRSVITPRRINNWLKHDLGKSKYSEKKWSILYAVCKVRPPKIPAALVEKFFEMFGQVEKAFAKHVPPGRVHFFNYGYILRKFSESLDQRHLLSVFTILKGTDRVHFQDDIWKKCCADLGWKFIPSI